MGILSIKETSLMFCLILNHPNIWCNKVQQQRHASVGLFNTHMINWILPLINARASEPVNVAFIWQTPTHWRVPVKYEVTSLDHWTLGALDEWLAVAFEESRHYKPEELHPNFPIKNFPFIRPHFLSESFFFRHTIQRKTPSYVWHYLKSQIIKQAGHSALLWTHRYGN